MINPLKIPSMVPRLFGFRAKEPGLPPGELVHVGEKKVEEVSISVIDYDAEQLQEREVKKVA